MLSRVAKSMVRFNQIKVQQVFQRCVFSFVIAVDRFPSVERERIDSTSDSSSGTATMTRNRSTSATTGKLQEHAHAREVIFALPSLQLHLKTEHLQTALTPDIIGLFQCFTRCFPPLSITCFFFIYTLRTSQTYCVQ